jgi:hypothetical protein
LVMKAALSHRAVDAISSVQTAQRLVKADKRAAADDRSHTHTL